MRSCISVSLSFLTGLSLVSIFAARVKSLQYSFKSNSSAHILTSQVNSVSFYFLAFVSSVFTRENLFLTAALLTAIIRHVRAKLKSSLNAGH